MRSRKSYVSLLGENYVTMKAKLTLNIEREVSLRAKAYAKSEGRSLSDLVEDVLKALIFSKDNKEIKLSPRIKGLAGSIQIDGDVDYKQEYQEYIIRKYTRKDESFS